MPLDKEQPEAFDPRAPAWRGKLWVRLVLPHGRERVHVFWHRIAGWLGAIALGLWLSAAAAVAGFAWQRGVADVAYLDLVWPGGWPRYRAALGTHHWQAAQLAHAERRTRDVFPSLHAALRHSPANIEARRLLAIYYIRAGYPQFASDCLALGLPDASRDLDYLKLLFGLLDEQQNDARVLALCATLLPLRPTNDLIDCYVAMQNAAAHYHRGRYDQAESVVADWGLERSVEGQLLLARCDWERGLQQVAIERLENEQPRFPGRDELPRELLRFKRELGGTDDWRRESLLRVLALPDGPGPRVDWLASLRATRDTAWSPETERFLTDFSTDAAALALLAWHAADVGDPALALRARTAAQAAGCSPNAFVLAHVQAAINVGDPAQALALAAESGAINTEGNPHFAPALAGLRALALYAAGDQERGEIELAAFADHNGTRAADGVWLARELRRLGADQPARRLLTAAVSLDPLNQAALGELIRVTADLGRFDELTIHVPRLLDMRKPSRELLREVAFKLSRQPADTHPSLRAMLTKALRESSP